MQLRTTDYTDSLYQEAKNFFLREGRSDFLVKKPLSLCARYCISQKMKELWFLHFIPEDWIYQCGIYTFAISYSVDKLFFAVDTENIVVDVEKIIQRRGNIDFYMQRCAKECIVKRLQLSLDESETFQVKCNPLSPHPNPTKLEVTYAGKTYPVHVRSENGYVYAVMKKFPTSTPKRTPKKSKYKYEH